MISSVGWSFLLDRDVLSCFYVWFQVGLVDLGAQGALGARFWTPQLGGLLDPGARFWTPHLGGLLDLAN